MKLLIVSNGYGEDSIATKLILECQKQDPSLTVYPAPLVGRGKAYEQIGLNPVCKSKVPPSGGFLRRWKDWAADLTSGSIGTQKANRKTIKELSKTVDLTIAVGDVFCLTMAGKGNPSPVYFLPTAKSDAFMPHSMLEIPIIKRLAAHTFPRDSITTNTLKEKGINATYLGNPMMDGLIQSAPPIELDPDRKIITLLPGSREESIQNLTLLLDLIEELHIHNPNLQWLLAKAFTLSFKDIREITKKNPWRLVYKAPELKLYHTQKGITIIISEDFTSAIAAAHLVIGLAGTANEQAIHMNRPVVTFKGTGPQSTLKRFKEQQKLLGENLHVLEDPNPKTQARAIIKILNTLPETPTKLPPATNASEKIITHILKGA